MCNKGNADSCSRRQPSGIMHDASISVAVLSVLPTRFKQFAAAFNGLPMVNHLSISPTHGQVQAHRVETDAFPGLHGGRYSVAQCLHQAECTAWHQHKVNMSVPPSEWIWWCWDPHHLTELGQPTVCIAGLARDGLSGCYTGYAGLAMLA